MSMITLKQFLQRYGIKPFSKREWKSSEKILGMYGQSMKLHRGLLWSIDIGGERKYVFGDAPINLLPPETKAKIKKMIAKKRLELHPDKAKVSAEQKEFLSKKMAFFNDGVKSFLNVPPDSAVVYTLGFYSSDVFNKKKWKSVENINEVNEEVSCILSKLDSIHKEVASNMMGDVCVRNNETLQALYVEVVGYMFEAFGKQKWCQHQEGLSVLNFFYNMVETRNYVDGNMHKLIKNFNKRCRKLYVKLENRNELTMLTENHGDILSLTKWCTKMSELLEKMDIRVNTSNDFFNVALKDVVYSKEVVIPSTIEAVTNSLVVSDSRIAILKGSTLIWMEKDATTPLLNTSTSTLTKDTAIAPVLVNGHVVSTKYSGRDKKRKAFEFDCVDPTSGVHFSTNWSDIQKFGTFYDGTSFKKLKSI